MRAHFVFQPFRFNFFDYIYSMKQLGTVLSLIILMSFMSACNKPVYKYNPSFVGTWRSIPLFDTNLGYETQSEIVIKDSDGSFKNSCKPCGVDLCDCINIQSGRAVMNDQKTQMRIGSNGTALVINEEPNVNSNGQWTMTIQGKQYYKQ